MVAGIKVSRLFEVRADAPSQLHDRSICLRLPGPADLGGLDLPENAAHGLRGAAPP